MTRPVEIDPKTEERVLSAITLMRSTATFRNVSWLIASWIATNGPVKPSDMNQKHAEMLIEIAAMAYAAGHRMGFDDASGKNASLRLADHITKTYPNGPDKK